MSGRRKGGSELVSGHGGNVLVSASGPDGIQPQPYSVGESTFYVSTARETQETRQGGEKFKLDNLAYPVQEASLEASVTSENVTTIMQQARLQQHNPVCPEPSYDEIDSEEIKIVVLGDKFVGKSSLIAKTAEKQFTCVYNHTRNLMLRSKTVKVKGKLYVVIFWDLPNDILSDDGLCKAFCQGAMAALVVYDLSRSEQTLPSTTVWKKMINNNVCMQNGDPIPVYLLGNKRDLEGFQRDGAEFAKNNKFADHFTTSAKTGDGINEVVRQVAKNIVKDRPPHLPVIVETPDHLKVS